MARTEMIDMPDAAGGLRIREFRLQVEGRRVPARLWTRKGNHGPMPLVLVGHGGSGHKDSQLVRDIAEPLALKHGFAVAAIDGPVHGARRETFSDGPDVRQEFRDLWATATSIPAMVADWRATLDVLCSLPEINAAAIGWYGISMGTAYGIPLVAADPRIHAAVLGMWGSCRPASEQLVTDAEKITCPVLFQTKAGETLFTVEGQQDIYDHFASKRKEHRVYPGGHVDPKDEQLADIEEFLVRELSAPEPRSFSVQA